MARELEALRNQRGDDNGLKSTVSPSNPDTFDSPEYTLEQSGTAVLSEFGLNQEHFQLGTFVIDRENVIELFKV